MNGAPRALPIAVAVAIVALPLASLLGAGEVGGFRMFTRIERAIGGPLPRVKLVEAAGPGRRAVGRREARPAGEAGRVETEAARREAEDAARRARALIEARAKTPAVLPLLRPAWLMPAGEDSGAAKRPVGTGRPGRPDAAADTMR